MECLKKRVGIILGLGQKCNVFSSVIFFFFGVGCLIFYLFFSLSVRFLVLMKGQNEIKCYISINSLGGGGDVGQFVFIGCSLTRYIVKGRRS